MTYFYQIHTYRSDYHLLVTCLKCVKAYDPEAFVQVITDGPYVNAEQKAFIEAHSNQLVIGERLKLWKTSKMEWMVRRFKLAIETKKDICVKLDPDTRMWRKPLYVPKADYFGTISGVHPTEKIRYVQGGCMGVSTRLMQEIIDGDFFNGVRVVPVLHPASGTLMEDPTIAKMISMLGIAYTEWDEVLSRYAGNKITANPLLNGVPRYAITHPHKWKETVEVGEDEKTEIQN